ncbi:hypothetical protein GLX30_26000 [Streptomyces sp. Tu 2975]|uniref:hypothetical protein n=1 Tax=Streptomyces sp. Tu 2975 TaxID=2676871 RepID=UPI0013570331|nr:hypothetical protein [Streptomyces sp. Tu 2975]QIP86905.1 hypothetical protein GLX30_26000 [Streptomyces sp. Tu 2975]
MCGSAAWRGLIDGDAAWAAMLAGYGEEPADPAERIVAGYREEPADPPGAKPFRCGSAALRGKPRTS